jgi:hypothetical protein
MKMQYSIFRIIKLPVKFEAKLNAILNKKIKIEVILYEFQVHIMHFAILMLTL